MAAASLYDPKTALADNEYWEAVRDNFQTSNTVIPGLLAPTGLGLATAGGVANRMGGLTFGDWLRQGFSSTPILRDGYLALTRVDTILQVGRVSVVNFGVTSAGWEGGLAVGSLVNALPVVGSSGTLREWYANKMYESWGPSGK